MMDTFEIPGHLLEKIDAKHLSQFMADEGLFSTGSKEAMLIHLIDALNDEEDTTEKDQLVASYHEFLLKTIKHNNNRIVITYPLLTTDQLPYYSEKNLCSKFEVSSVSELYFSDVIRGGILKKNRFELLYRNITTSEGLTDLIEVCFGRTGEFTRSDDRKAIFYDYVWCEIDSNNQSLRVIMSEPPAGFSTQSNENKTKVRQNLIGRLKFEYGLIFKEIDDKQTLFKMYKYLTAHIEEPYSKQVLPFKNDIEDFVNNVKKELSISDTEDINLTYRIQKLFERNLIQNDFINFRTKKVDDGRILNISYSDEVGGNVKASSGGYFFNGQINQELDLQDSSVYFDTKESIYNDKKLSSITVSWVNKSQFKDDRFTTINVKYSAYKNCYITHFLRYNVREEIYNYVLPKFDEYKRKPI